MRSAVTFDIDWAPDWCVQLCRDLCAEAGAPATFFATHPSPFLEELKADKRFEVGIHPNFMDGSSHGRTPDEVIEYCQRLVPNARIMRTHGLVQSTQILHMVMNRAPGIECDASLFLPFHDNLAATRLWLGAPRSLKRLPYFWEDDVAALTPGWKWDSPVPESSGLRIFDFHPIHVALNMSDMGQYQELKTSLGRPLSTATPEELDRLRNLGLGAQTFLKTVLQALKGDLALCADLGGDV